MPSTPELSGLPDPPKPCAPLHRMARLPVGRLIQEAMVNDQDRTKEQLVDDLAVARKRIAELEAAAVEARSVERALRASEERFRVALKNSKLVAYNQDRDLRYTWIYNPLLGFTPEGIVGRTDADLLLPEDAAHLDQIKRKVLESGGGMRETVRTIIDGDAYFYDLTVEPLRDRAGSIVGVTGASRDITERVRVEEALRESELRFKAQYKGLPIPVYTWRKSGEDFVLTDYNDAAERITHGAVAQMVGAKASEMYQDSPDILQELWQCYREQRSFQREMLYHFRTTRESRYLSVSYGFVPPDLVLVHTDDVTERKRAESQRDATLQVLQERTHDLGERIKELNCLYGISRLREKPGISLEEFLQGTVALIPPAWQYPEITGARVILHGQEFRTKRFEEDAAWRQTSDIIIHGQRSGMVEVCYLAERPDSDEGPFLQEERTLLNAIAERLGRVTEHKRAEQEYETILKTALDGFWIGDTQGRILEANDSLCQMLGYTREELLAMSIADVEEAETAEEVEQHTKMVVDQGYDRFESRLRHKDGRPIDIEASVSHMGAEGGRFFAFIQDISERKRAEEVLRRAHDDLELRVKGRTAALHSANQALRASEEKWRSLVENAPVRVTTVDREGTILFINHTAPGRTIQEAVGSTIYQYLPPDERDKARQALRAVFDTGQRVVYEATVVRADGTTVTYENRVAPIMDSGRIDMAIFISMDITERVRAEEGQRKALAEALQATQALRESEELYRAIFERNQAVKLLIDPQSGAIVDTNPAAVEFYGYPPEELKSMAITDINTLPSERVRREMAQAAVEQGSYSRFRHRLASGEVRDVEVHSSPIDVRGRRLLYAIIHDISERVQAEQEIERSHQRESVLNTLLRISMEDTSLEEQLERALNEILATPWLPVLRRGAIFVVGDNSTVLELQTQRGFGPAHQVACARVDFGECLCGRAAASGEVQFTHNVGDGHKVRYEGIDPHGHYCIPMLSGDKAIGTIVLYLTEGQPRDAQQEEFLQAVAHTLAGIVERKRAESQRDEMLEALRQGEQQLRALNERLEDYSRNLEQRVVARTHEIEQRRQVAESLRDILTVLNSNRPLDEILDHIVTEASRLLGSDTSAIYSLAEPAETFRVQTAQGLATDLELPPELYQALREGQPVAVSDVDRAFADSRTPNLPQINPVAFLPDGCQALLAVPLIVTDEVYGGLVLYYSESRAFSDEEIGLAVAFADQAALAIENARLHQQAEEAAVLEERGRLARELHDSVTQQLYSLTLLAEGWRRLEKAGRLTDTEDPLTELGQIAQQALKEMRLMVHELRPPDLEEVGLLGALHQRLGAVEKRAGVEARLVADDIVELPARVEAGLYRIAIEALNNALKHSAATSVTVRLRADEERVELEVADNGLGFDLSTIDESRGVGLNSMQERTEQLGGTVEIQSAPGEGTKVRVSVETHRNS